MSDLASRNYSIIVIGASAGGVEALTRLVEQLPSDLAAAVFIVIHFPVDSTSVLPNILRRVGELPADHAVSGETICPGRIYVGLPNYHLLIERGRMRLFFGPRENGHRPAIDILFRSAARSYRKRVIGVVLSGMLDDGTAGLAIIKQQGGTAIVQDPEDALFDGMPRNAIAHTPVDHILPVAEIPSKLVQLTQNFAEAGDDPMSEEMEREVEIVNHDRQRLEKGNRPGETTMLTCPGCGGVLWELNSSNLLRYRCHVGHAYSAETLVSEQSDILETALWSAVRALEERATLMRRMAAQAEEQNRALSAKRFREQAEEIAQQTHTIRQIIEGKIQVSLAESRSNEGNGSSS